MFFSSWSSIIFLSPHVLVEIKIVLNRELKKASDEHHYGISALGCAGCNLALEGVVGARLSVRLCKVWCFGYSATAAPSANTANQLAWRDSPCPSVFSSGVDCCQCHSIIRPTMPWMAP